MNVAAKVGRVEGIERICNYAMQSNEGRRKPRRETAHIGGWREVERVATMLGVQSVVVAKEHARMHMRVFRDID